MSCGDRDKTTLLEWCEALSLQSDLHQISEQMKNETNVPRRPEWKYQMLICTLVSAEKLSTRLGQIATVWATTILLGGFVSGLSSYDFWVISAMALASTLRLFGSTQEHKLNQKSRRRRHVLGKWLCGGHKKFHISSDTVIAGSLDLLMYVLQLASALVSLVLSILRICQRNFGGSAQGANQKDAMMLYYTLVLVEASLFLPAKICWELPSPGQHEKLIRKMTYDTERLSMIFNIFDDYFMSVLTTSRQSVVQALEMSLREYISDMLVESSNNAAACILVLETLHEPGELIKTKAQAQKRAKLLPFLFHHIDSSKDHESREAAISLVNSLLMNKTNAPEQYKFGPLVLLKAMDSPKAVDILTGESSLARPVAEYLKTCLVSANKHEVSLGIDVVRRLDLKSEFLLRNHIVGVMADQINAPLTGQHPRLAAMMVLTLGERGLQSRIDSVQASRAVEVLLKGTMIWELEILVKLDARGLISRKQKQRVDIAEFFKEKNFIRCLPWIIEWISSMDNEIFHEVFEKQLDSAAKERLVKLVETSMVKIRPDLIKFCRLLVRHTFFKSKIEQSPTLGQLLLQPQEEC